MTPKPATESSETRTTRVSVLWFTVVVALVLLVLLIIFMLQNSNEVEVHFFGFEALIPLGLTVLIATVAGGLLVVIVGVIRMTQLRRRERRQRHDLTKS